MSDGQSDSRREMDSGGWTLNSAPPVRSSAGLADSATWPHVMAFAERMESKLAKNRHKGDREGWLNVPAEQLIQRLLDEVVELTQAHADGDAERVANECADVSNFAMMVADWYLEHAKVNA